MTTEAVVYLPESVHNLKVVGPAIIVLDAVRTMTHCDFQGCGLVYRGEKVSSLREWLEKAGKL